MTVTRSQLTTVCTCIYCHSDHNACSLSTQTMIIYTSILHVAV